MHCRCVFHTTQALEHPAASPSGTGNFRLELRVHCYPVEVAPETSEKNPETASRGEKSKASEVAELKAYMNIHPGTTSLGQNAAFDQTTGTRKGIKGKQPVCSFCQ